MSALTTLLAKLFGGTVGSGIANTGIALAIISALGAAWLWLTGAEGEKVFITITYRQAAFWFAILAVMVLIAKFSPTPHRRSDDLQDWKPPKD